MTIATLQIPGTGLHRNPNVLVTGGSIAESKAVMILLHGRGATAESILELAQYFTFDGVSYIAPQATGNVWYPYSFLVPLEQNEPWLSAALQRLTEVVDHVVATGVPENKIIVLGFSQGASLSLEWTARTARQVAGVFALSGGLIGPPGTPREYGGTFNDTAVFLGCSDVDFHIPKERVNESAEVFTRMKAQVTKRLYPNMDHTVNDDEIAAVSSFLRKMTER